MKGELVCISEGCGVQEGQKFPVLAENKSTWCSGLIIPDTILGGTVATMT
ncbi:hypothetical protein ACET6W_17325 [Aeromonas veronii]